MKSMLLHKHISPPCVIFLIKNPWCSITTFAQKTFGMGVLMHHASRHNQKCAKKILCCSDGSGTYYSKQFLHIWWFFFQSIMRQMSQSHTVNNHKTKKLAKNKEKPCSIYLKHINRWFQTSQKSNFEYLIQRCYVLLWSKNSNSSK